MTFLRNRKLNGQPYILAGTFAPALPGAPMSQAFTLTNWGSATSLGVHKRGVWFKKGDVPAGQIPTLSSGTAQFYGLARWSDGSLKQARLLLRDAGLVAGASRSYTMTTANGTLSGAVAATGNAGLVSASAGHDFKMTFANVKDYQGSAYGGGSLVASLSTHAAVSTRWTLLTTGAVADVWQGWGMAGSDAHLKVNWYLTRLKNPDGSTLAWRVGAVMSLDQWSAAGKTDLTYDATLADGSTTILSFPGVQHYYHSQWLACVNDGSLNAGTIPWVGATQPTLHCAFDKPYAVGTGLVPPYRTGKMPVVAPQYAYVPCNTVADPNTTDHPNSHRTAIDAVGLYQGRGALTRFDVDAFMAQTPQATAVAVLNALTGLSAPYHYRSSRPRARPGESADIANTNIVLLMSPKPSSASNFTAQGLPVAVDAYRGGPTPTDSWLAPNRLSGNPWGEGSSDSSHAVSYCYYAGLVTGDEHFVDAQLDLTLNLAHQSFFDYHQQVRPFSATFNPSTPAGTWTGLLGQWQQNNQRYVGWSQLVAGHGFGGLPDDHPYKPAATALMSHQGDYIGTVLDYLPADFAAGGVYYPDSGNSLYSPWMAGFGAIGAYAHYLCNEDARWQRLGNHIANWAIGQASAGRWYMWDAYRTIMRRSATAGWNASSNPIIPVVQQPYLELQPSLDASGVFTQSTGNQWQVNGCYPPPLRNGDVQTITAMDDGANITSKTIPGVAEGTVGYVVNLVPGSQLTGRGNPTTPPKWQLSATLGGAPMTFGGAVVASVNIAECPQSVADPANAVQGGSGDYLIFPYYGDWSNYMPINMAVLMMARQAGNAAATTDLRSKAIAFMAPMDTGPYAYYSGFDMATAA